MANEEAIDLVFQVENLPKDAFNGSRIVVLGSSSSETFYHASDVEIGRTEKRYELDQVIFNEKIRVMFKFGVPQIFKVYMCVYESDSDEVSWTTGEATISVFQIFRQNGTFKTILTFPGYSLNTAPILTVQAQVSEPLKPCTFFQFVGHSLISRNSYPVRPYYSLWLVPKAGGFPILLYRSEVLDTKNPKWKGFTLPNKLFGTSSDGILKVTCHNMNSNYADSDIGNFSTTFYQLLKGSGPMNKYILHYNSYEKKKEEMSMELVGIRRVESTISIPSIIASGVQLHMTIAIDFTTHNGSPSDVTSLHATHPMSQSVYGKRLSKIAQELKNLGLKASFLGFGAKIPNTYSKNLELSQCFALNDNILNPFCESMEEIDALYKRRVINSLFYAPTNFASIIANVRKQAIAAERANKPIYFVLMIMTRGHVSDVHSFKDSLEEITKCAKYPISVVFIGVGNESHPIKTDPDTMFVKFLEQKGKTSDNVVQDREVVSFVDTTSDSVVPTLTTQLFSNVSRQMVLYNFKSMH